MCWEMPQLWISGGSGFQRDFDVHWVNQLIQVSHINNSRSPIINMEKPYLEVTHLTNHNEHKTSF